MKNGSTEARANLGRTRFPILIRIADYAEHGLPRGKSLSDFLADYCCMYECPQAGLADLLATELRAGNCLILLDGLDEIVSADERRNVVQHIEISSAVTPVTPITLLSPAVLRAIVLPHWAAHFTISKYRTWMNCKFAAF